MSNVEREIRRIFAGSTYWVRQCGAAWKVTADGVCIWGPGEYAEALRQLNSLTANDFPQDR